MDSLRPQLAVVADDLTGALDAAAPFAAAGLAVAVATRIGALPAALATGASVVAVSTRSREMAAGEARSAVAAALAALPAGVRLIKKIDSRLKGNIEAELDAFGAMPLAVLPAIPEFSRVVEGGCLGGFGLAEPLPVAERLGRHAARATIPDVGSVAAMRAAVAAVAAGTLLVGARGLTSALAAGLARRPAAAPPVLERPVVVIVGSADPITLAQVEALSAAEPGLVAIDAPAGAVPGDARMGTVTLIRAVAGEPAAPAAVAERLARGALPMARQAASLVLTGGATAEAVLDAMGLDLLQPLGEVLPGLPICRAGDRLIVTKSGGFGAPSTLAALVAAPQPVGAAS